VNNRHTQVLDDDFNYALKEYSDFLYQNLIAEMTSEFPNIRFILENLHSKYLGKMEFKNLSIILLSLLDNNESMMISLIDTLIVNGYFEIINERTGEKYKKYEDAYNSYLESFYKILWFKIKKKRQNIFVILSPQYSRITRR
jgi:hypothetical protein